MRRSCCRRRRTSGTGSSQVQGGSIRESSLGNQIGAGARPGQQEGHVAVVLRTAEQRAESDSRGTVRARWDTVTQVVHFAEQLAQLYNCPSVDLAPTICSIVCGLAN